MKKNICCLLILISISCILCSPKNRITKPLIELFEFYQVDFSDNIKVIVLIPLEGCDSCIEPAIMYSKRHISSNTIYFVLITKFKKILYDKYSLSEVKEINIIHDIDLLSQKRNLVSIAPSIYFLKAKKVIRIEDLSKTYDKISVYDDIEEYLLKNL